MQNHAGISTRESVGRICAASQHATEQESCASRVYSISVAAASCAVLVWSAQPEPLPAVLWAAVFGFLVVESDVRTRRIPNTLTALGLVVALAVAFVAHGWAGVGLAVLGAGLALGILFPFFAFRALGAGDVKAMMVLGALIGPLVLVELLPWTALAGGVLAVATAARYGLLLGILRRWAGSIMTSIALRRVVLMSPEKPLTVRGVPFGVAIIWGASAHQLWGALWQ